MFATNTHSEADRVKGRHTLSASTTYNVQGTQRLFASTNIDSVFRREKREKESDKCFMLPIVTPICSRWSDPIVVRSNRNYVIRLLTYHILQYLFRLVGGIDLGGRGRPRVDQRLWKFEAAQPALC